MNNAQYGDLTKEFIYQAFDWFERFVEQQKSIKAPSSIKTIRIFSKDEIARIDTESRNFLLAAENSDILNARTREIAINNILELEQEKIDLFDVKWAILMALLSQSEATSSEQLNKFLLETSAQKV